MRYRLRWRLIYDRAAGPDGNLRRLDKSETITGQAISLARGNRRLLQP